jgi:hypothetical protein
MTRYRFIVSATLSALEQDLNRIADEDPDLELRQVLLAQGTGFVAVVEYGRGPETAPEPDQAREGQRKARKAGAGKA